MQIIRIDAICPPDDNRSRWVREMLAVALANGVTPAVYPLARAQSFTVTLQGAMVEQLQTLAQQYGRSVSQLVCGLIEAQRQHEGAPQAATSERKPEDLNAFVGGESVRTLLYPMLRDGDAAMQAGKIVFAEAATGTGKGNLIASLAATAAQRGDTVVIAAPLTVTWQLIDNLSAIKETQKLGVALVLGRANFISPERLGEWAAENGSQAVAEWLDAGAPPLAERLKQAGARLSTRLAYLLEDALSLAPDLPVDYCMLDADDDQQSCPAEALYLEQRQHKGRAAIIVCSHYMLAASFRTRLIRGDLNEDSAGALPAFIDSLIVDEAHLLEGAFAAINAHTLRLRPLMTSIDRDVSRGKKAAMDALRQLYSLLQDPATVQQSRGGCALNDLDGLKAALEQAQSALAAIKPNTLPSHTRLRLRVAGMAIKDALSGFSRIRVDLSPIKGYPMLLSGRANLNKAFAALWDNCAGVFLTSATLYSDENNGSLIRWKLEVPKDRVLYLPAIHPGWVVDPVTRMQINPPVACVPDDSPAWVQETSQAIAHIACKAKGGTLVLCTSLLNVEQLAQALAKDSALTGRLVVQSGHQNASMCAMLFRSMAQSSIRPVWLGVGAAWTGIDLTDRLAAPADDTLLTDLVITRLPVGLNRSITHDRREKMAGFRIVIQEAVWMFRQGLGRLVRREGVRNRCLWVLDARLSGPDPWVTPFNRLLRRYRTQQN